MIYLDAFTVTETEKKLWTPLTAKTQVRYKEAGNVGITLFSLPGRWMKRPDKLPARMEKAAAGRARGGELWLSGELRRLLKWQMPLPGMEWLREIRAGQPLCAQMILILPDFGRDQEWRELEEETAFLEEFLQGDYDGLNGLLVVSKALEGCGSRSLFLEDRIPYFRRIYQETGLVAVCAGSLREDMRPGEAHSSPFSAGGAGAPAGEARRLPRTGTLCIDMRRGCRVPFRGLPAGTRYLDMTSEPDKERILRAKRKDVRYMSALNVLDTYVRNGYNTSGIRENNRPETDAYKTSGKRKDERHGRKEKYPDI